MAKLGISTGLIPDDGTGDSLLEGAIKINSNFNEIYNYFGNGTNLTFTNIWSSNNSGVHTLSNVGIGTTIPTEKLTVFGSARITGILTVGSSSITIDGNNNIIRVGSGVTINGLTGAISVSSINIGGSTINGIGVTFITAGSGISVNKNTGNVVITATGANWSTTTAGINTLSKVGIGTTNPNYTLEVKGGIGVTNLYVTGVTTASSFVKSGGTSSQFLKADGSVDSTSYASQTQVGLATAGLLTATGNGSSLTGIITSITAGSGISVNQSTGNVTISATGVSLQSRTTVTGVTTSIANNGIGNTNITGFKSYALMKVGLSTAGWLRLYTDSASRAADVSRSVGIDPAPGSGVIAEVVTTGISTTQIISPFVMGGNLDNPADTTIYAAITNLSGSTQAITANLTILQLEA